MHASFCSQALPEDSEESIYTTQGQTVLDASDVERPSHPSCNTFSAIQKARSRITAGPVLHDAKVAALHFMIAAHPSPQIAHHLEADFERHLEAMTSSPLAHFVKHGVGAAPVEKIEGLPGSVNPVPAKLVYVQSPDGESTKLTLAWKLEVEMEDNWYEAYMDAMHPSHIHSVIDWASDAAVAPIPKTPEPEALPTYKVWKWGINDPSEGKRSLESGYDKIASPIGWHSIPAGNDPLATSVDDPSLLINYTTTWGNNVRSQCLVRRWEYRLSMFVL
jgi:extracellular elastinolytic metalloproteinase